MSYRKVWEMHYGKIPKGIGGRSLEVHHINGDHSDNRIENLKLVTIKEHYDIHYSQGDYAACHLIAKRMCSDPKELSAIVSGLNKKRIGSLNPFYGKTHTEETKKILKQKSSGENNYWYGKKRPEHGLKVSQSLTGKLKTEEHKKALSNSKKGKASKKYSWVVQHGQTQITVVNLKQFCRDINFSYSKFYHGIEHAGYKLIGRA
jgi:hypothetical protein